MKIGYFIRTYVGKDTEGKPGFSGGIKIFSQHVKLLNGMGYETLLITRYLPAGLNLAELNLYEKPTVVNAAGDFPECDLYVGTALGDVKELFRKRKRMVVHLCQGYEPIDYRLRIRGEVNKKRYLGKGIFSILLKHADLLKFKRRIKRIESLYALPTIKAAVSRHLVELLERRFRQKCFLIQNGIDPNIFYPRERRAWRENGRIKILSVGPMQVGSKGIPDVLQSIKILRDKGIPLEFTRVSAYPPSEREEVGKAVDYYCMNLREQEMAELYRRVDIFISSSLEGEGFGLPAMEALASGVPCILTEISSHKNFDVQRDFAYFVPIHRPDRIAEGVLAFIEDKNLRAKCVDRGIEVAKGFTLERTKQDLTNFMKGVMG